MAVTIGWTASSEGSQIWNLRTIWELVKEDGIFLSLWTSFSLLTYEPLFTNLEVMVKVWWKCGGNYPPLRSTGISSGFATLQDACTFLLSETMNTIFSLHICLVFIQTAGAGIFPNNASPKLLVLHMWKLSLRGVKWIGEIAELSPGSLSLDLSSVLPYSSGQALLLFSLTESHTDS